GARINRAVGLSRADVRMVPEDVLAGKLATAGFGSAGGNRHLPEPLASRLGSVRTGRGRRAARAHLQERRLGEYADVRPGGVELLGLGLFVPFLAAAVERRSLVADDEIVELLRYGRGDHAASLLDVAFRILARHRRHLPREQERRAAQVYRPR